MSGIYKAVGRAPRASLLLTLAAVVVHLSFSLRLGLLYDRAALSHYELWRLVTCHWVHLSWDHLFWSAMTFLGLGFLCELMDRRRFYATVVVSALLIPAAIWLGMPHLFIYGGLSGIDCSLYALLMVMLIKREIHSGSRPWVVCFSLLLLGLAAKISYETITGLTLFVSNAHSGMVPVPLAHLVGGIVGIVTGLMKVAAAGSNAFSKVPDDILFYPVTESHRNRYQDRWRPPKL